MFAPTPIHGLALAQNARWYWLNRPPAAIRGFTLIELLIVVAIIAVLAAIAVPNFLEAQVRAKAGRAKNDMRALATAIESYYIDNNSYPEGTDNPSNYPQHIGDYLGPLAAGYYTFRTRDGAAGLSVGAHFAGLTTPISYIAAIGNDPFAGASFLSYSYRNAKIARNGWIITSAGPDMDLKAPIGRGNSNMANPLSTARDLKIPSRLGDINEVEYVNIIEGVPVVATRQDVPFLRNYLADLSYDPTNGSVSDGDIWRVGP